MRGQPVRYTDFHGGVNTKAGAYLVADNECRDCRNVVSTTRGSVRKRNGNSTFCSSFTGAPATIMSLQGIEVGATVLFATGSTKFYSISTGGASSDITGGTAVTTGLRWETIEAPTSGGQGPIYTTNGTDIPKYWTGAGNTADWTATSGTVPVAKYMVYFKNRVFMAGVAAFPSRLYASAIGDPRDWSTTNGYVVDLDPNDGDVITGLGTFGPYLLVFKRNKLFRVYDLDTGANNPISISIGAASHRSITETPIGTFFLTNDKGVYLYSSTGLQQISPNISPTVDGIIPAQKEFAAGGYVNNHYYLSVCVSGSANNLTLDYDVELGSWWFHTNTANQFCLWKPASQYELYAAQASGAIVDRSYVSNILQDNAANFQWYWYGPWLTVSGVFRRHYIPEPYRHKRIRQIHVDGSGVVDAFLSKDFTTGGGVLLKSDIFNFTTSGTLFGGANNFGGTGLFGDVPGQSEKHLYSLGVCRAFSFQISATSAQSGEMDSYTPFITQRQN